MSQSVRENPERLGIDLVGLRSLSWSRRWDPLRLAPRALRILIGLWFSCLPATTGLAQKVHTIPVMPNVSCDNKNFQLRLVSAETLIASKTARAFGIVLHPEQTSDDKMFFLYWTDDASEKPTHRDDTDGALDLRAYRDGKTSSGIPVVEAFFQGSKCAGVQPVSEIQKLMKDIGAPPDLPTVMLNLKLASETEPEESSASLIRFQGLTNLPAFAGAIRDYMSRRTQQSGTKTPLTIPQKSSAREQTLLSENENLADRVKELEVERASFFRAAPLWLIVGFFASSIGLVGLVVVGRKYYKRRSPEDPDAQKISNKLTALLMKSRERLQALEAKPAEATQVDSPMTSLKQPLKGGVSAPSLEGELIDDWHLAYTGLHKQLEEFQRESFPDRLSAGTAVESTAAIESLRSGQPSMERDKLAAELVGMKAELSGVRKSVDSFDGRLTKGQEGHQNLQKLWKLWNGKEHSGGSMDSLVKELSEVIDLYISLNSRFGKSGLAQTQKNLSTVFENLNYIRETHLRIWLEAGAAPNEVTAKIITKIANDAEMVTEYKAIQRSLQSNGKAKPSEAVTQLISERSKAVRELGKYYPNLDLARTIDEIVLGYDGIEKQVWRVLPGERGSPLHLVGLLVSDHQRIRLLADKVPDLQETCSDLQQKLRDASSQLEASSNLVEEIGAQLNLRPEFVKGDRAITRTLERLRQERESSVYRQLRMGLCSAMIALEKAVNANDTDAYLAVIDALYLRNVLKGIKQLLTEMETFSGDQLWSRGLSAGFSQNWLHYLIRADLLLHTYFDRSEFRLVRKAVVLARSAIMVALSEFNVEVDEVPLLGPLPRGMETEPVHPGLRNLRAVTEKVERKLENSVPGEIVMDVTSFPYWVNGKQEYRGCAVLVNPSAYGQH